MTHPSAKARLRPIMEPTLPPGIINIAITSVYSVMAVWMPVIVVPTSLATVAMATFITEVSRVMTNWPAPSVSSTKPVFDFTSVFDMSGCYPGVASSCDMQPDGQGLR